MKLGIVTIFAVPNYGAMLQAHALGAHLRASGHDAVTIDYRQPALERYFAFKFRFPPAVQHWLRLRACDRFVERVIRKSPRRVRSLEEFASEVPNYDGFITGSDQVWFTGPVQFYDRLYFLDFPAPGKRKISYAGSAGGNKSWGEFEPQVRAALNQFDHLGVRDTHTAGLVQQVTNKRLHTTVDPVFLHDFDDVASPTSPTTEPYIAVFGDFRGDLAPLVRQVRERTGIRQVVSLQYSCPESTRRIAAPEPAAWLTWLKHASFVVTSYFHGTVVAVKYRRPFISVPTPGRREKVSTLLEPFGLRDRCLAFPDEFPRLPEVVNRPIAWDEVHAELDKRIDASKEFLRMALA